MLHPLLWISLVLVVPQSFEARAEVELPKNGVLFNCPFYQSDDPFNVDGLMGMVKAALEAKLNGKAQCEAPLTKLLGSLSTISNYYGSLDPSAKDQVNFEVTGKYILDLQMQMSAVKLDRSHYPPTTPEYIEKSAQIAALDSSIQKFEESQLSTQASNLAHSQEFQQTRENKFRGDLYGQVGVFLQNLRAIDPKCVDAMGGWAPMLGSVMGVASLATGYTGFANQAVAGAALDVMANLTALLSDSKVKHALNQITNVQNDQVLACTYYAIKYSACEYRRAYQFSSKTDEIRRLIEREYQPGQVGEFEKLFSQQERVGSFSAIFNSVATMGSALTFDLNLIIQYLEARIIDPNMLPVLPDHATDAEKSRWLIDLRARGLSVSSSNNYGEPKTLDMMVKEANATIEKAKATIIAVEQLLREKRSFEDLRHELDAQYPHALGDFSELKLFLQKFAGLAKEAPSPVPERERGAIEAMLDIVDKIESFLKVSPTTVEPCPASLEESPAKGLAPPLVCYQRELNFRGSAVFEAMARGAVAQINAQSVLTLGSKSTDRLLRAMRVVENEFLWEDINGNTSDPASGKISFRDYRRDRMLLHQVIENYAQFRATGANFRAEKYQTTLESFEDGFSKEIRRMVKRSLSQESELIPEIDSKTAPHLCSLFASTLKKGFFKRRLLKRCRENFNVLEQLEIIDPKPLTIDYEDSCFYVKYVRTLEVQKRLLERKQ